MKPEKKMVALTSEAAAILDSLNARGKTSLAALKAESGLSNKRWDKSIKELTQNGLAKVEKTEEGLFVEVPD